MVTFDFTDAFIFDFLAPLSDAGIKFYTDQAHRVIYRFFNPDFIWVWVLAIVIYLLAPKLKINPTKHQKKKLKILFLSIPILFVSYCVFYLTNGVPHFEDEFAYCMQAEAMSKFTYPGPRIIPKFKNSYTVPEIDFLQLNPMNELASPYPPGYSFILSLFYHLDLEKYFLPIFLIFNCFLLYLLCETLFKSRATVPILIFCTSYSFLSFSCFYFSQNLSLSIICLILLCRKKDLPLWIDYSLASLLFLTRFGDGFIVFCSLGLYSLFVKKRKPMLIPIFVLITSLFIIYLIHLTCGNPSKCSLFHNYVRYGYSSIVGMQEPYGYNLIQAVRNLFMVLITLNEKLFGWPSLSLLPILLFGFQSFRLKIKHNQFLCFNLILVCFWFFYYFNYFFPGVLEFGSRFHAPLFPVFIVFSGYCILLNPRLKPVFVAFSIISVCLFTRFLIIDGHDQKRFEPDNLQSERFFDAIGVISKPHQYFNINDKQNYIIPHLYLSHKPLMASFLFLNNPYSDKPRFLSELDYIQDKEFYDELYEYNLRPLPLCKKKSALLLRSLRIAEATKNIKTNCSEEVVNDQKCW
jgi:hypothetical protein